MKPKYSVCLMSTAVILVLLAVSSCAPPITTVQTAQAQSPAITTAGGAETGFVAGSDGATSAPAVEGGVGISVKPVSQAVLDLIKEKRAATPVNVDKSRAYLSAARVEIDIVQAATVIDSTVLYPMQGGPAGGLENATAWYGAIGEYTVNVRVYNQPYDDQPAVQGSAPFMIYQNENASSNTVSVVCVPALPTPLTEGQPYDASSLPLTWSGDDDWSTIYPGSEQWFEAMPTSTLTNVVVTPSPGSQAELSLFIYDGQGVYLTDAYSWGYGQPVSFYAGPTMPGSTYYVGIIDFSDSTFDRSYSIEFFPTSVTPLAQFATWTDGSLPAGGVVVHSFPGLAQTAYAINWDDSFRGSGSTTADIEVTAQLADGTPFFSEEDSGYVGPDYYSYGTHYAQQIDDTHYIGPLSADSTVLLIVRGWDSSESGSFRIMVAPAAQ